MTIIPALRARCQKKPNSALTLHTVTQGPKVQSWFTNKIVPQCVQSRHLVDRVDGEPVWLGSPDFAVLLL